MRLAVCLLMMAAALPGAVETELKDDAGKTIIRYVVEAPDKIAPAGTTDPARQVGLILCFPEHERPTGDEILPVREALKRMGLSDGYVLLAGHSQALKMGPADDEPITKLIAWAKKTYPINPRRVYMYGKGEGGKISGEFAVLYPDIVTASITHSWGWWRMPSEAKQAIDQDKAPEFYMVLGLRDLSYHLTTVRDTYSRVQAKGYHVIYREFEDMGARTYYPPSNNDSIAWVTRLRNKNIPPSAQEMNLLKHVSAPENGYFPTVALVGGAPAGEVVRRLLDSKDAKIRAAAAETCVHGIFNEATIAAVAAKSADPSPEVRLAVMRALAVNANWRSQEAQKALVGIALNPDHAERADAVDGIAQAVHLQIKGVRQDPQLFKALVALLDDKDEELRVMAANTLAPIRDRDYRGDLGRKELKAPEGGWQHWLDQVTAKAEGYGKDYEVCSAPQKPDDAVALFCKGGEFRNRKDPVKAFELTLQAAEKGYVPAQAQAGMMYADGIGVEQNYAEARKWWEQAANGGHALAASNLSMVYRGVPGLPGDMKLSEKWALFASEHGAR